MKIVTLNIWEGRLVEDLSSFFELHEDVDVFLLQEVLDNATEVTAWEGCAQREIFNDIKKLLPNHVGYFASSVFQEWGLAMFIRNYISVQESGDVFVHKHRESMVGRDGATVGRNIQYARVVYEYKLLTIINFHGLWNGKGKSDTEDRMQQSRRVINFIKNIKHDVVLGGDFNLLPDTKSIRLFEHDLGLKNLISDFNIYSTRTSFYTKSIKFADYVFTSPSVRIKVFKVMEEEVSDHAPLYLEI